MTDLSEDNEYDFRVAAENEAGLSKYAEIDLPIRMRDPYGEKSSKFHKYVANSLKVIKPLSDWRLYEVVMECFLKTREMDVH